MGGGGMGGGMGGGGMGGGGGPGSDLFSQFPEEYRAPGTAGGVARLYSRPLAYHSGVLYIALNDKIVLADSATFALHGTMGEADMTLAPAAGEWVFGAEGMTVYAPAEELYVCTNYAPNVGGTRVGSILVFGIGGHPHAGRCVRRLSGVGLRRPSWVAVGGEGSSLFVADGAQVKRLTRHGVLLQVLHMFECTVERIAVGVGASDGEVWLLCTGPDEWNVYGEPDSTVHVLTLRSTAQQAAAAPALTSDAARASAAQGEAAAAAEGTGRWASSDGLAVEYGGAAVLSDWQQRTLEAAYRRGDATLQYPFRGDMHTFTLRPPEQRRVVDGQGKAADLRRNQ